MVKYVPLTPPPNGSTEKTSAGGWKFDMDALSAAVTPRTRMLVLNTPHNPVGKVFSRSELEAIGSVCLEHGILILSDEVYDRLPYVPFTRIATLSPELASQTLTVGSIGKNFYATGWRIGYLMGPSNLIQHVATAHTRICFTSPSPLQEAAAVGFEQADALDFWNQSRIEMQSKMNRFCAIFDELGLPYSVPEGGYFVLANLAKVQLPDGYDWPTQVQERPRDFKMSWWMIMELGVAAIPPTEFYTKENAPMAEEWIRFAVCKEDEVLDQAKDRLRGLKEFME